MRAARAALVIALLALAGWITLALLGRQVMPSYLAAWLFCMAVPLGALPLVMGLEALGDPARATTATLRRFLPLLPVGGLLSLPLLLTSGHLFRRAELANPLPAWWMAPRLFAGRMIAILVILSGFALLFRGSARRPRRFLAGVGLILHVCLITLGAADWLLSLQPGLASSEFGLLLIASQVGVAGCLAGIVLAVRSGGNIGADATGPLLATLLGAWLFLHFVQYLVVWSANLPDEVVWYGVRTHGFGGFTIAFAAVAALAGLAVLPTRLARIPPVLASFAAMLLLMHLLETLWLVTPAFRGHFSLGLSDILAMLGLGGLTVAAAAMLTGGRHASA